MLKIAPVDPRSLMQGDYMALSYAILNDIRANLNESEDGVILAKEKKHPNAFKESLPWMNADEFGRYNASKKNCIYTLASEPDIDGKRKIYVGEAQYLQNRLKIFKVNNETYIDHTKKEAEEHRFTRFRVDVLKDDAYAFLHSAQDSIIGALWMLKEECPNGYIMTNKALSMPISQAYSKDKINKNSEEDK